MGDGTQKSGSWTRLVVTAVCCIILTIVLFAFITMATATALWLVMLK